MRAQVDTPEYELKKKLSAIAGIELSPAWFICDRRENVGLYMIRYREDRPDLLNDWGHVRGWVIDLQNQRVICGSIRASEPIISNSIEKTDEQYQVRHQSGNSYCFDTKTTTIQRGYDGVLLRIFKHQGVIYLINTRRFTIAKSFRQYNPEKTFLNMYQEAGGPDLDSMYEDQDQNGDYCYYLMLVHPDLLISTKENVDIGYVVYLGSECLDLETTQIKWSPEFSETLVETEDLDLEEANKYLMYGKYEPIKDFRGDVRLLPGEFLVIKSETGIYVVQSKSYHWRYQLRDNSPNLYFQFMKLVDISSHTKWTIYEREQYYRKYPIMPEIDPVTIKKIVEKKPLVCWRSPVNSQIRNKDQVVYNTWFCLILALPLAHQDSVLGFYKQYKQDRQKLVIWMKSLKRDGLNLDPNIHRQTKWLIQNALKSKTEIDISRLNGALLYQMIQNYKKKFRNNM